MNDNLQYYATDRNGVTWMNPDVAELRKILLSLDQISPDHPEVWLSHFASGWCLSAFPGGTLHLDNEIAKHPTRELKNLSSTKMLELWLRLTRGEIDQIIVHPWKIINEDEIESGWLES